MHLKLILNERVTTSEKKENYQNKVSHILVIQSSSHDGFSFLKLLKKLDIKTATNKVTFLCLSYKICLIIYSLEKLIFKNRKLKIFVLPQMKSYAIRMVIGCPNVWPKGVLPSLFMEIEN